MAAVKSRAAGDGGDGVAGKIELGEGLETEHAGAVHRRPDLSVLFENEDREPFRGQQTRNGQAGRPAPDHHCVPFACR